jgi:hypothetical protein
MTAIAERPATAPATATPEDVATYVPAAREYARQHPGNGTGAVRAGLDAVLTNRERHPATTVRAGLHATGDRAECDALQQSGWLLVGLGTHRLTGGILYVLERAPSARDGGQ